MKSCQYIAMAQNADGGQEVIYEDLWVIYVYFVTLKYTFLSFAGVCSSEQQQEALITYFPQSSPFCFPLTIKIMWLQTPN